MKSRLLYSTVLFVLLASILMSVAPYNGGGNESAKKSFFDRLNTQTVTKFTLTFDVDQLDAMKKVDSYYPATFSHNGDNWDAKIKVRGRYRRRVCDFPPLKLKLSKDMLAAAGLQRHNKFKLVTHCSDDFDNRDNVLREQLAYDLYHLITGEGYRTQLVQVTYQNAKTGETTERFGILIEDTDEMAQAMSSTECDECVNIPQAEFAAANLEQVSLFQYMIGNADWQITMPRNIKIVQNAQENNYRAVPYDFDFSGLVNAEYAIPNPDYALRSVKDRVLLWDFESTPDWEQAKNLFLSKEMEVMAYVNHYDLLSNKSKRQVSDYLSSFFKELKQGAIPVAQ